MARPLSVSTGLVASALFFAAGSAHAAFIGLLGIDCRPSTASPTSSSKKGITTTVSPSGGEPNTDPFWVKSIRGIIAIRPISGSTAGVQITRGQLTAAEAYGAGSPLSNGAPNYAGPYTGMMWPFRDVYDFNPNSQRNANQVGNIFDEGNQFLIADTINLGSTSIPGAMVGYAIGGPTESQFTGADMSVDRMFRGVPGNGVFPVLGSTPETGFFKFDIDVGSLGPQDFDISILGEMTLVVRNQQTGVFREMNVAIDPTAFRVTIPTPGAAALLVPAGLLFARRRR